MKLKTPFLFAALLFCGAVILLLALCGGSSWYTPAELFSPDLEVIAALRLRRIITAFLVGSALAAGGTACQAVLHNDLADPYLLGISGGASLGAALAILSGAVLYSVWALPGGAFCGAMAALAAVLIPAALKRDTGTGILLSGVILGAICSSLLMLMISVMGNTRLNSIVWWLLGDLSGSENAILIPAAVLIAGGLAVLMIFARATNVLSLGAHFAHGFGVSPRRAAVILLGTAALLAGTAVSLSGIIGFAGLIVPHIARRMVGAEHRKLYPAAFFCGGLFLVLCDWAARSVFLEQELPVGVVTSLIGGPFFLYLLYRKRAGGGAV